MCGPLYEAPLLRKQTGLANIAVHDAVLRLNAGNGHVQLAFLTLSRRLARAPWPPSRQKKGAIDPFGVRMALTVPDEAIASVRQTSAAYCGVTVALSPLPWM
jgi:hypothetical protein